MSNHNGLHFEEKNTEHQYIIDALAQSSHFDYDTLRSHKILQDLLTWQDVTWPDIDTWLLTIDTWRLIHNNVLQLNIYPINQGSIHNETLQNEAWRPKLQYKKT